MSSQMDDFDLERLADLSEQIGEYVTDLKQAIVDGSDDSDVGELAEDLWELLDQVEDILETIDFEEVPEAVDVDDLPEAVDVEDVPEGLFDDEENAIELTSVREAVNLRELWDAVDLTQLYEEKQQLEDEVEDVEEDVSDDEDDEDGLIGDDGLVGDDDDEEDDELFEDVIGVGEGAHVEFDAEARQAVVEEKIQDAVVKFREVLLTTHENLRKLYEMNQEKLGQSGRQPQSLNPTATSTLPSGPVPNSASVRTSTVPSQVRYSRVENPRRIYAHRFNKATSDEEEGEKEEDEADDDLIDADISIFGDDEEETEDEETATDKDGDADEGGDGETDDEGRDEAEQEGESENDEDEIIIEVHDE